jgi:predicted enzyme related to lactoylglutathione lyase
MATTAPAFGLSAIGQIHVTVHDVERAVAFYRDTLGMQFLFQAPPAMAFFNCGGVRLMLGVPSDPQFDHPASTIYYKVANIEAAYETLKSRGAQFVSKPHLVARLPDHDLWLVELRDPEGNILALMCEKPRT